MKITFASEAREELAEAVRWYAKEAGPSRATDFRNAVHRTITLLTDHPAMGTPSRGDTRRIVVHHYPYSVVYRADSETLRVLAIANHSRRPGYWAARR